MSDFNVGDKALMDVEVINTSNLEPKYYVKTGWGASEWVFENEIHHEPTKTYEDGLREAWDTARRIVCESQSEDSLSNNDIYKIFDTNSFQNIFSLTAARAAEKIRLWENENRIHVGDVCKLNGGKKVLVTKNYYLNNSENCKLLYPNGDVSSASVQALTKTGRSINIQAVFDEINNEKKE